MAVCRPASWLFLVRFILNAVGRGARPKEPNLGSATCNTDSRSGFFESLPSQAKPAHIAPGKLQPGATYPVTLNKPHYPKPDGDTSTLIVHVTWGYGEAVHAWLDSTNDLQLLDQYLAQLSQANPKAAASTPAKLAFWINAYNAVTVRGILREYPTRSIRDHQSKTFGYKIWHDLLLTVGGQGYSLHQMEHEILRPMGEPRIHFAIVCASIGCPPLLNAAYTAQDLETQLTSNSKRFFADPTKFSVTAQGELRLSKILQWFPKDFGPNQAAQLQTIAPYLPTSEAQNLAKSGRARIGYLEYDWRLNDQASLRR